LVERFEDVEKIDEDVERMEEVEDGGFGEVNVVKLDDSAGLSIPIVLLASAKKFSETRLSTSNFLYISIQDL
jgi:hypothetical protein